MRLAFPKKNIVLSLLSMAISVPQFSARAVDQDDINLATKIAIGAGAFVLYKAYELYALSKAKFLLKNNEAVSERIMKADRTTMQLDDQKLVNNYKKNQKGYAALCSTVARDKIILNRISQETADDINYWRRTAQSGWFFENRSVANIFFVKALEFYRKNETNFAQVTHRYNFFDKRKPLIGLAALVHEDKKSEKPQFRITQRVLKIMSEEENMQYSCKIDEKEGSVKEITKRFRIEESEVKACSQQSEHQLLDVVKKINDRSEDYKAKMKLVNAFANKSDCAKCYLNKGIEFLGAYYWTRVSIASFPAYIQDYVCQKFTRNGKKNNS